MQPHYFVADSFGRAKEQITEYCENISKPFQVSYNDANNTVDVDRKMTTRHEIDNGPVF